MVNIPESATLLSNTSVKADMEQTPKKKKSEYTRGIYLYDTKLKRISEEIYSKKIISIRTSNESGINKKRV